MRFHCYFIKKYPLSVICITLIWILSLVPFFPETPLDSVEMADKWVHVTMYCLSFTVLWAEYAFKHLHPDYEKLFVWAWVAPILMSGLLEILQEYCTGGHRNGDWYDLMANAIGVTLAAFIGLMILYFRPRR